MGANLLRKFIANGSSQNLLQIGSREVAGVSHRGEQFLQNTVQADDDGISAIVEMAANRFTHAGTESFPSVGLGDDGMAESTGDEATASFIFGDVKDDLVHRFKPVGG